MSCGCDIRLVSLSLDIMSPEHMRTLPKCLGVRLSNGCVVSLAMNRFAQAAHFALLPPAFATWWGNWVLGGTCVIQANLRVFRRTRNRAFRSARTLSVSMQPRWIYFCRNGNETGGILELCFRLVLICELQKRSNWFADPYGMKFVRDNMRLWSKMQFEPDERELSAAKIPSSGGEKADDSRP